MAKPIRRSGNLPVETTSFIGRRRQVATVKRTLSTARLVTLVGPGGVGKTRLAVHVAAELGPRLRSGAWLVELNEVDDPATVDDRLVVALDLRDQASVGPRELVLGHVRDREMLLVIDGCEHLLSTVVPLVSELLATAPGLRLIVTSREPLSVSGEHVVPVPPLDLSSPTSRPADPRSIEAVALFVERAAAASGAFDLTTTNEAGVLELCRRLDGLPLAIELAAVRTRVIGVDQIIERLDDRFALLSRRTVAGATRHQALRTAIDWSHDLLAPDERTLFRRLGIFGGRFSLEDAEAVCAASSAITDDVVDLLSSLVDKSLVVKEEIADRAAYRLHESMREYARVRLREADEADAVERATVDRYASRCLRSWDDAQGHLPEWLDWVNFEIDTIRWLLGRCLDHGDVEHGLIIAGSLGWFWSIRATSEGVRWLEAVLRLEGGGGTPRARAWFSRGFLAVAQGDETAARTAFATAIEGARAMGDTTLVALGLSAASVAENLAGDRVAAGRLLADARRYTDASDDVQTRLGYLHATALDALFRGDLNAVRSHSEAGLELSQSHGFRYITELMESNLGFVELGRGAVEAAMRHFREALRIAQLIDDRVGQANLLSALAGRAATAAQAHLAATLLGAAQTIRTEAGGRPLPGITALVGEARESAVAMLGPMRFEAARAAGSAMDRSSAIILALGEPPSGTVATRPRAGIGRPMKAPPVTDAPDNDPDRPALPVLSAREREIAGLVAEGLTNRDIGVRLFISERTVDAHVRHILDKLGVNSRAQVAALVGSSEH